MKDMPTFALKPKAPPQGVAVSGRLAASSRGVGLIGIFPKLAISEPGDTFEEEADRVADRVMNFPLIGTSAAQNLPG